MQPHGHGLHVGMQGVSELQAPCSDIVCPSRKYPVHQDSLHALQIDLNVWARTLLHLAWPEFAEPVPSSAPASQRRASVLVWGGTSAAGALLAFSIASLLPYFSTVMGLVAAIGDVSAAYLLPSLFCLKLLPERLSPLQRGLCWVLVPVSVLLSVAGTWASGSELLAQIRHDKHV